MPALPGITLPVGMPVFQGAGHGIKPGNVFARFKPKSGHHRVRRVWTIAPRTVAVELFLTENQTFLFEQWYQDVLLAGERPFSAQVAEQGGSVSLLWWYAEWETPPQYAPIPSLAGYWRASGSLRLSGNGSILPPENTSLEIEFGAALNITATATISTAMAVEFTADLDQASQMAVEFTAILEQFTPLETIYRVTRGGDARVTRGGDERTLR